MKHQPQNRCRSRGTHAGNAKESQNEEGRNKHTCDGPDNCKQWKEWIGRRKSWNLDRFELDSFMKEKMVQNCVDY